MKAVKLTRNNAMHGTTVRLKKECLGIPAGAVGTIVDTVGYSPRVDQAPWYDLADVKLRIKWHDKKHRDKERIANYHAGLRSQPFYWISTKLEALGHPDVPNLYSYQID